MGNTKEHVAEVLKMAIKGEQDGYRFYNMLADKAKNDDAKRKLEGLRDDEIRHEETLRSLFAQHVGGEIGELPEHGINALAQVFRRGLERERTTEMEYINLAIEAELAATKYYQTERDLVDDDQFKDIFDRLAEEEHSHFELLQAEKDALAGNYSWFSWDEGSPMEY